MIKKVIGCSQNGYTGWLVWTEETQRGRSTIELVHHVFCQTLTKDPVLAKKLWGTDEIDESLKHMSTFTNERTAFTPGYMRIGKFAGEAYEDVPENYLGWYYANAAAEDELDAVAKLLVEKWHWKTYEGRPVSKDDLSLKDQLERANIEREDTLNGCTEIEVDCHKNLDNEGMYYDQDRALVIKFPEYKVLTYNHFNYAVPIDNTGQAKKIKGRTIIITSWDVLSRDMISVNEWETKKL